METKFNFNSDICTSIEQSKRLLELGLKKETANMIWFDHALTDDYEDWRAEPIPRDWEGWINDDIPAWSLHRLMSLIKDYNITFIDNVIIVDKYKAFQKCYEFWDDVYDNFIDCIEWLIKEGYFDKKYLENEMEEKA